MSEITQVLLNAQNSDESIQKPAEQQLKLFEQQNLSGYIGAICSELASEERPAESRQLAGILMKNVIVGGNEAASFALQARWLALPEKEVRSLVKQILLTTLSSPIRPIRSTAAQVIASIANVEIPKKQWTEVISILVSNISTTSNVSLRASSFEALGFICELVPDHLQSFSVDILNAISFGMSASSPNEIKLAATQALSNSLEFVQEPMADEAKRRLIMQMIFAMTVVDDIPIRKAAYSCLVTIAATYYEHLGSYMGDLFGLTSKAMASEAEEVAQMATEFWTTVAEEEAAILEDEAEALNEGAGREVQRKCAKYTETAFPNIAPILLQNLTKQNEDPDEDEWNVAEAAGSCLTFAAQAAGDKVVSVVLPFITANIADANWRLREAATLAFGCILAGPSPDVMKPLVTQAFGRILTHLQDPQQHVVDTAAWTIGRICSIVPETITGEMLPHLISAFVFGLQQSPKIAAHICWAIHNLANNVEGTETTSPLSPFMKPLLEALLAASDRKDNRTLLMPAYEAVNVLINTAATDTFPLIGQLVPAILNRLSATLMQTGLTGEAKEKQNEMQGLLCGSLQVIIQRDVDSTIQKNADAIMTLFLRVLESKSSTVLEEAIMAIGALANRIGKPFEAYIPHLKPYLLLGLNNFTEAKVCDICVGLVGDIARAIEDKFVVIGDEIMTVLLRLLQSDAIDRMIKPTIFMATSDVALALGSRFDRYLPFVLNMLIQASKLSSKDADDDTLDYIYALRLAILESYSGIMLSLGAENLPLLIKNVNSIEEMLVFLDLLASEFSASESADPSFVPSDDLVRASACLISDLVDTFQRDVAPSLKRPSVHYLVTKAEKSLDDRAKEEGQRAMTGLQKILS